jgi:hypothetical protein
VFDFDRVAQGQPAQTGLHLMKTVRPFAENAQPEIDFGG